jgi:hypothetical protein
MTKSFSAQIENIAGLIEQDLQKVLRQSVQDLGDIAQRPAAQGGPMPVDNSDLRNSFATEINGTGVAEGEAAHTLTIAQLEPGDLMRMGWSIEYARRRNYEPVNGRPFRDEAAAQWQDIVTRNANRVRR